MKESEKRFIKTWEKTRSEGFIKYALTHGLGFGIIITIVNLLILHFNEEKEWSVGKFIVGALVMIVISGFSYAGVSWLINEYLYKKKVKSKE